MMMSRRTPGVEAGKEEALDSRERISLISSQVTRDKVSLSSISFTNVLEIRIMAASL